jgi:hypothetical protein
MACAGWSRRAWRSGHLRLELRRLHERAVPGPRGPRPSAPRAPARRSPHWDGYDTHYTERYMGTPAENPEGYRQASV